MRRYFVLALLLALVIGIVGFTPSARADRDAVEVCHLVDGFDGHAIVVNGHSVQKHIDQHGDCTFDRRFEPGFAAEPVFQADGSCYCQPF